MIIEVSATTRLALNLFRSARVFPYGVYLITIFPIFAVLIDQDYVNTPWLLLRILPFIFAMAAGFTYNTVCDAKTDPIDKNPISRGELTERTARNAVAVYAAIAVVLFIAMYQNMTSFGLFIIYLLLWFTYSGLRIRLKESIFATAVASFVLWVGPPSIILSEFEYFTNTLALLLFGLFALYVGYETKHTVIEHDMDMKFGLRTFAVIVGRKRSTMIEYTTLIIGYALLLRCLMFLEEQETGYIIPFFSALFALSLAMTIYYGHRVGYAPTRDSIFVTLPYISTKIFIIVFGLIVLNISELLVFFIVWFFLSRRWS